MLFLALCLALFLLTHLLKVIAPQFRARMIATMGEGPFKGVYSVVSLITLGLVIYAFGEARQETGMLWYPPVWMSHIAITLMLLAMICLVGGALRHRSVGGFHPETARMVDRRSAHRHVGNRRFPLTYQAK